jgi:hypothetical protein
LGTPNLTVEQVLKRVRIDVAGETKQRQIPWESSSLMGDFYFKTEKVSPTSPPADVAVQKAAPGSQPSGTEREKIDLEGKQTSSQTASLPPSIPETMAGSGKKKLVILPIHFPPTPLKWYTADQQAYSDTKNAAIATLKDVLISHRDFYPTYSYYELSNKLTYKKFDPETLTKEIENNLWDKKTEKPNIKLMVQLGKNFNADYVFACLCGPFSLDVYLIEVLKNEVFYKTYNYNNLTGYSNVPTQMKNFFANYKDFKVN